METKSIIGRVLRGTGVWLLAAALIGCWSVNAPAAGIDGNLDFALKDLDGKEVRLSEFLGKPIIVVFWATFCPTCKEEIPYLIQFYEKHKSGDLVFLSLAMDKKSPERIKEFTDRNGIHYPVLSADSKTARRWGVRAIPAAFMIDRKGEVVHRLSGLNMTVDMKRYLDEITAE
jgi:peroxiredoxin